VAAWATRQPGMGWGGREGGLGRWGMQDTGVCTGVLQGVEAGEGIFECNPGFGALVGQVIRPERRVGYRGLYRGNIGGRGD
jgi:hypothetical protein